jgi:hypothetical protein
MKYFFISILIIGSLFSCKNKSEKEMDAARKAGADSANFTSIHWIDSIVKFGAINKGDKIDVKFRCQNTGTKPLILVNVVPGCGCTVANYTKEPIAPGAEGLITASFDSKKVGSSGEVNKTIIVTTNTKNGTEHYLYFQGTINGGSTNDKVVEPHPIPNKN